MEWILFGFVVFESVEENRSSLLEYVLRYEDVDNLVKVNERVVFIVDELCSKFGIFVGVDMYKMLKKLSIVRSIVDFFGVENNFVKLFEFSEISNDFVRNVGMKVDG